MPNDIKTNFGAIAELLTEKWAMSRERVLATLARIAAGPQACGYDDADDEPETGYAIKDGIATIDVVGVLKKYPSWWATSTIEIQQSIERALADYQVRSIVLKIDCPGGQYAGTNELGDFIAKVNGSGPGQKPIDAVISDLAASGGYWLASQCRSISCNPGGFSGCIGVYTVLLDDSKFWEEMGISWELISSGGVKGMGTDGKITAEYRADMQREITDMFNMFTAAVARGRGMDLAKAQQVGDGRAWIAEQAKSLGLIDTIANVGEAVSAITKETAMLTAEQVKAYLAEHPDDPALVATREKSLAEGKSAGLIEGRKAGMLAAAAIMAIFGLADHPATASIKAGDDEATAKRIADAQASAKAEAERAAKAQSDALAAANAENERLKAELGTQGPLNLTGAAAAANKQQQTTTVTANPNNPEAQAKAEWAANTNRCQDNFLDEGTYVSFRKQELKGRVSTTKLKAE